MKVFEELPHRPFSRYVNFIRFFFFLQITENVQIATETIFHGYYGDYFYFCNKIVRFDFHVYFHRNLINRDNFIHLLFIIFA